MQVVSPCCFCVDCRVKTMRKHGLCTVHSLALANISVMQVAVVWLLHLFNSPVKVGECLCLTRGCPTLSLAFSANSVVFPAKSASQLGSVTVHLKRGCAISLFFCCLFDVHFQFSVPLVNCEAVQWVSPPSPSLVGQIVRQQDLRCPFLVISGGNECYHNPLSLFPSLALSLSVPCQNHLKSLSAACCRSFSHVLKHVLLVFFSLPVLPICASIPLCFLFWLAFSTPVALCSPLFSVACLVAFLWSGTLCGWLDCQGWCARKASAHQKHTGSWGCGASLEPLRSGSWG